jgi:hypothetical protein
MTKMQPALTGLTWLVVSAVCLAPSRAPAQELEPGAYTVSPTGTNLFNAGYTFNGGEVAFDPSLPIDEASADIHTLVLSYGRSVGIAGRSGTVLVAVPIIDGHLEGLVFGAPQAADRRGLGDMRIRVGLNLYGAPARRLPEFVKAPPSPWNLGASVMIVAPTGQYDSARFVNLGNNRWAFKPEAAVIRNLGPWMFEIYGGAWLFTDNDNYVNGQVRSQDPIASLQFSARRTFRPGLWVSGNANFYRGGRTKVGETFNQDLQSNSRVGATVSYPFNPRRSVRFAVSRGAYTTIGADFVAFSASFQQAF